MNYALLLWPHANIRYMDSLKKLALNELLCLFKSLSLDCMPRYETLGGAPFLVFEAEPLDERALSRLCTHSSMYMLMEKNGETLTPIAPSYPWYLNADVAEILKYKGKTNATFTMMMLSCALAASDFANAPTPLWVLDPLCGKGTTLFCALRRGFHAIGIEMDRKDVKECGDFFSKYLQHYRFKHHKTQTSLTLPKGKSAPKTAFTFANDTGSERTLQLIWADTLETAGLLKPESVHLIIADLPYGVQHAPEGTEHKKGVLPLLNKALPKWYQVLKQGGTIALSFNTFTLKKSDLAHALRTAGYTVLTDAPYHDFEHYVEQAVNREMIIAKK